MDRLERETLELLARGAPLPEVLEHLVRGHERLYPGTIGSCLLLDDAGRRVHTGAAPRLPPAFTAALEGAEIGPEEGSCGTAAYTGREVIATDIATDHRWVRYRAVALPHGLRACWSVPFFAADGAVLGTFALYYREPRSPSPGELEAIRRAARLAGIAADHERRERQRLDLLAKEAAARAAAETAQAETLEILERIADGFVALDRDWCYRYVNRVAGAMFGRDPASLIGRHIWTEFPEGVGQPFHLAYERAMAEQVVIRVEDYYAPWDRWFENTIYPSPDGIAIYFQDVTERRRAAEALRLSRDRLALVVEGTGTGLWDWDLATDAVYFSPEWKRILGYADDEVRHEFSEWERLTEPTDAAATMERVRAYLARPEGSLVTEFRMRHKDGSWRWINNRSSVALGEDGAPMRLLGMHVDVTARRETEDAIARDADRRRLLFEEAADGIAVINEDFRVVEANRAFARMLRCPVAELLRLHVYDWDETSDTPEKLRIALSEVPTAPRTVETSIRRRDGTVFDAEVSYNSVRWGGQVQSFLVCRDVSARVVAERELQRSLDLRARVEDLGQVGAFVYAMDSGEVWLSDVAASILGAGAAEGQFEDYVARVHPHDRPGYIEDLSRLQPGQPRSLRVRYTGDDGQLRHIVVRAVLALDEHGARILTGALLDMTEDAEREQDLRDLAAAREEAREAERARVAREIHDELGQSVTALKLDVAWLRERLPPDPALAERADAALDLLDETAQMARRIAGDLRPGALDDLGLEAAIRWQVREFAQRTGISVRVEATGGEAALADGPATAAFRILQEALTNVVRHAGARGVVVRLATTPEEFRLEIADDGRGIAGRAPAAGRRRRGLGLLGMRERAATWGGRLTVQPGPRAGTVVRFTLPRTAA